MEGNVERLLLPVMIEQEAPTLRSACLSLLEVGGAFAHRFRSLIEFLGLTVLVITDIDSVTALTADTQAEEDDDATEFEVPHHDAQQQNVKKRGKSCLPCTEGAITSNQTLIQWIPKGKRTAGYSVFWGRGACKCSVVDFAKDATAPLTPNVRSIQPLGPPSPPGLWPGE